MLNTAERKRTITKIMSGRSKGELRNVSLPSVMVLRTKKIKKSDVATASAICLGRINASVVMVRKKRGRIRRKSPITKRLMFSK